VVFDEATGAFSVAAVIAPHVENVVVANPEQVRITAHVRIKDSFPAASEPSDAYSDTYTVVSTGHSSFRLSFDPIGGLNYVNGAPVRPSGFGDQVGE
jgi:hypothetical protein